MSNNEQNNSDQGTSHLQLIEWVEEDRSYTTRMSNKFRNGISCHSTVHIDVIVASSYQKPTKYH